MFYLFPLILSKLSFLGTFISVLRIIRSTYPRVEEREHFLFAIICIIVLLFVWPSIEAGIKLWVLTSLIIISSLFYCSSPLLLYTFFELSLLPVLLLIIGWGVQSERVRAGFHLIIYTFLLSRPLFLIIVSTTNVSTQRRGPLFRLFIGIAFIVKTPLYFTHVWLPKAHVEAPTAGSILLARILLKIGGVGFIWTLNYCNCEFNLIYIFCALLGATFAALTCSLQRDLKALIAYRSIAHINYSTFIVILHRVTRDSRRRLLILRHSFVRRILFLVGGTCFHRLRRRLIYFLKRTFLFKETFFLFLFLVSAGNFSIPPLLRFFGELSSLITSVNSLWVVSLPLCFYFLFVAYYSLFLLLSLVGKKGTLTINDNYTGCILIVTFCLADFLFLTFY